MCPLSSTILQHLVNFATTLSPTRTYAHSRYDTQSVVSMVVADSACGIWFAVGYPILGMGTQLMKPTDFKGSNIIFAKDQPEYQPLPAHLTQDVTTTCWVLTWRERWEILCSGKLWLQQLNFGAALQPQLPSSKRPTL